MTFLERARLAKGIYGFDTRFHISVEPDQSDRR